ncbi:UAP56-interacting factor-like [Carassius carassius]|uniref:UAP56-interacting factor-like n=1 Tax=Carassius carassius TaxID=217509 RepID=UPI0028687545|nr:UAP56-interacting factor-like [Carassius carassius]
MSKSSYKTVCSRSTEELDKVDMSLDDIIRLNKKQKHFQAPRTKRRVPVKGQGKKSVPFRRGAVVNKRLTRNRKLPPTVARRRGQGVITGLAVRKNAVLYKGINPLNRPVQNRPAPNSAAVNQYRQICNVNKLILYPINHSTALICLFFRTCFSVKMIAFCCSSFLYRKTPTAQQTQRDARQATFLFRRGIKVHTQVHKTKSTQLTQRTRSWRTPTNSSGILTVSIDNPTVRTQPEPAQSWSLHPVTPEEPERKPPKGVALQFDINSVGKQTGVTLNERFRLLKDQRVVAAQQSSRGGRFVTVA